MHHQDKQNIGHVTSLHAVEIVNIDWNIDMGSLYATLDELTNGLTNVNLQCVCCNDSVSGILFFSTKENAERAVEKLDKSTLEGRILHLRLIPNPFLSSNEPEIKKTPRKEFRLKYYLLPLLAILLSASLTLFKTSESNRSSRVHLKNEYQDRMNVLEFLFESSTGKGAIHHIGSGGDLWEYVNPAQSGAIRITQYPSMWGRGANHVLQRDGKKWSFTGPAKEGDSAFYEIDFGETRKIIPTHYTIRSLPLGSPKNAGELRHWVFEGSLDSSEWIELRRHSSSWWFGNQGDISLQGDNAAAWSVVDTTMTPFRYLRIRQTGDNAHVDESKRSVLFLSGFEVFGTLLEST